MNEDGTLASRTAEYVIGEPSLYGRRNSPGIATRSEGSLIGAVAYDSVYHRVFSADGAVIAWGANPRILIFDVHPERMVNGPDALAVLGQPDFTTRELGAIGPDRLGSRGATVLDERHQRLFVADPFNSRIMVWDVHPDRLSETPDAMAVIGQDDFMSRGPRGGTTGIANPASLHYDVATDRLFVTDSDNHRILIFDVSPESLENGMAASFVLGQVDFDGRGPGLGPDRLNRPGSLRYDHVNERLFVADVGNQRVLVFPSGADDLQTYPSAVHVLGQDDFFSSESRTDLRKLTPGAMILDVRGQRLLVSEGSVLNRMLVFDVHPDRLQNNPDAAAVLFQGDFGPPVRGTSAVLENSPRPFLDEETNTLYVASGYPGGNRVLLYDFSPENVRTGMPAFDVLGHYGPDGEPDFDARAAYGRINGRYVYPRAVALDPVDHRLFVNDQYNNRVVMYELDHENRIVERTARVVLGQPDEHSGQLRDIAANTMQIPLALAYDVNSKNLFVGDGWNNRVLVFDAHPERLTTFADAFAVLGQQHFTSGDPGVGADRLNFGVAWGRGIQSTAPTPLALEVDPGNQRLFVSDGINHRVLVFDIRPGELKTGAIAIGVLGQDDFQSNEPTPGESARATSNLLTVGERVVSGRPPADNRGFDTPSGLVYDANHDRLFVVDGNNSRVMGFDAAPDRWENGMPATVILGQPDASTTDEFRLDTEYASEETGRTRFRMASGIAYDSANDRLFVNDKGNDRVLIFDARPGVLDTGIAAAGVIGQQDFVSRIPGNGEQEQLLDPRELTFDPEHQRLFVTDSFWGRLMVFDFPRPGRTVTIPAHTAVSYSTLDAWNGRDDMPGRDGLETWRGQLSGAPLGAMQTVVSTRRVLDPLAKRRSRSLIAETTVTAPKPRTRTVFFVSGREGSHDILQLSNPDEDDIEVSLTLRGGGRTHAAAITVRGNGNAQVVLADLLGWARDGVAGALTVEASRAVASMLMTRMPGEDGGSVVLASAGSNHSEGETADRVLPGLLVGGGYRVEIVVLNPHDSTIEGEIALFDRDGEPLDLGDELAGPVSYRVGSGESLVATLQAPLTLAVGAYAVVTPAVGSAPTALARLSLRQGDRLLSETEIPARTPTQDAWIPVDTLPSILRHGDPRMDIAVANPSRTPATVRLTLFDARGRESGRWEQIFPAFSHRAYSLGDIFNKRRHRGSIRLWSDVPVGVSARRVTRNLDGNPVENEVGYVVPMELSEGSVEFPGIADGGGLATEITLINPASASAQAELQFSSDGGEPRAAILR